ncbi:hypothetical protein AYO40_03565 [Planctomycetaceae bacterium SCGC AG-212-D15]|nr:hypothetical protein AYO40_03565 [Planctomycetaceae bacterium SCGC AG-212-D15]
MTSLLIEVAERAYWRGWHERNRRPIDHGKPGEFFLTRLTEDEQARLRELTSAQAGNIRVDAIDHMLDPAYDEMGCRNCQVVCES